MTSITVVITTYNLESSIDKCFQELFAQTMQNFNILVVDDASTDNTVKIIEEWKSRTNNKITTIYLKKNLGLPGLSRNVALKSGLITGNYVIFLDGDDSIENDMLEKMYKLIIKKSKGKKNEIIDAVICAFDRINKKNGRIIDIEMKNFPEDIIMSADDDITVFINTASWNKLWRRKTIESLQFPACKIGNDAIFCFQAYTRCKRIIFLNEVLIHYSVHDDSITAKTEEKDIWKFAIELLKLYKDSTGSLKELAGFFTFVHLGLSMALRIFDNPKTDVKKHLARINKHFCIHYNWFRGNRFLTLASLKKHSLKGVLIWLALQAYRHGWFGPALACYRKLGLHIKF